MKEKIRSGLVFLVMKTKKYIQSICQNYCEDKHVDLLLIGERKEKHYVLIVEFIYDYTIDRRRKHFFFCYCLQALEQRTYWNIILMIALKSMVNKGLGCLWKVNMLNSKIMKEKYEKKIYADFEKILVLKIMKSKSKRFLYKQILKTCFMQLRL